MRLYPTRTAVHLALAGAALVTLGLLARQAAIIAWGSALVLGVAIARAATLVSVARIRAAGFEMVWAEPKRTLRVARGSEVVVEAEIRNRDSLAVRYAALRPLASNQLGAVRVEPIEGEVPAGGKLKVTLYAKAQRVGQHGIFGLALEVTGATGLFEVPLTFVNPYGIDVLPASYRLHLRSAQGGRARRTSEEGAAGRLRGEGYEFRELREYHAGDSFKRIAWRASARRGKLITRELDQSERDTVWVLLDASIELWSGPPGTAPLDLLIDETASLISQHIKRGDQVGVVVLGARELRWIAPNTGPAHGVRLLEALAYGSDTYDHDRSDLDESEVAARVLEHLRPLDARLSAARALHDIEALVERATQALARAPFSRETPLGISAHDTALRHYLASFGLESPARLESDQPLTHATLLRTLERLCVTKPRPSLLYIAAPAPKSLRPELTRAVRKLRHKGAVLRWLSPRLEPSLQALDDGRPEIHLVTQAMQTRARIAREQGERMLRRTGILPSPPNPFSRKGRGGISATNFPSPLAGEGRGVRALRERGGGPLWRSLKI